MWRKALVALILWIDDLVWPGGGDDDEESEG